MTSRPPSPEILALKRAASGRRCRPDAPREGVSPDELSLGWIPRSRSSGLRVRQDPVSGALHALAASAMYETLLPIRVIPSLCDVIISRRSG